VQILTDITMILLLNHTAPFLN